MKAKFEPVPAPKERLVSVELTPKEAVAVCNLIGKTSHTGRKNSGLSEKDNEILSFGFKGKGLFDSLDNALKRGGLR